MERLATHMCSHRIYWFVMRKPPVMSKKDVGMRIRVEASLRDEFLLTCHREGQPAAFVLRKFMREYVDAHQPGPEQGELFDDSAWGS